MKSESEKFMKAVVCTKYGPPEVLQFQDVEKPVPGDNEVLIKVRAVSLNAADWHLMRAEPFLVRLMGMGFFKPKHPILGEDVAGRIEAVGKNVTRFRVGDDVFGDLFADGGGGLAEYTCATEKSLVLKPKGLTYEQAAAVPIAAITALQGLRDYGKIQRGQKVLINGASGGVGTFAVQIARYFEAEVTAVTSTKNLDRVRSLGADHVIDYTREDFTKSGRQYDLIFAVNGYHSIWDYQRALSPKGIYVMAGGANAQMFQAMILGPVVSLISGKKMGGALAHTNQQDLAFLTELLEAGKLVPVIDRQYKLSETVKAMQYLEEGHARGKIVIAV